MESRGAFDIFEEDIDIRIELEENVDLETIHCASEVCLTYFLLLLPILLIISRLPIISEEQQRT